MHPHVVLIFVKHADQWFVHRRARTKRIYPGLWGLGAGGKVDDGESPLKAATRELQEELGICLDSTEQPDNPTHLKHLLDFKWSSPEVAYEGHVYLFEAKTLPHIVACTREFDQWKWVHAQTIDGMIQHNEISPDTARAWKMIHKSL